MLVNAQLLAEGWNSPRATVCMHLAPTASKRIYQQRVGRVTRRNPGKEAGIVVDFVHPATPHDDPVVTLHSLLDRDVYRGGAIVVGPVRRGRGRRLRVERRVLPVTADPDRRAAGLRARALAHRRGAPQLGRAAGLGRARGRAGGVQQLAPGARRCSTSTPPASCAAVPAHLPAAQPQLAAAPARAAARSPRARDPEAFDEAVEIVGGWSRDERREGVKVLLQALAERQIGRRDQAARWLWHLAEYTREVHEEYAVQRWPETKRLLGLLVNSSGGAHARNARRLVQAVAQAGPPARRRAAGRGARAHARGPARSCDGARMRMARKPSALARELLRNFPKGRRRRGGRRRRKKGGRREAAAAEAARRGRRTSSTPEARRGEPQDDDEDERDDDSRGRRRGSATTRSPSRGGPRRGQDEQRLRPPS